MKAKFFALTMALTLAACATTGGSNMLAADAPRALPADGPVAVMWADPAQFSEFLTSSNRFESAQGDWLNKLAQYMRTQATKQLAPGNSLELTIEDLQRAGRYEPWHGVERQNIRMIRDIYPPRMTVKFRELDASGNVVAEGERKITDPAFLLNTSPFNDTDTLRYEKRMIDSWLRREFGRPVANR